ncbi:hypothetical protein FOA43_000009 [Brettanomyces nanus]|uniref:Rab-GAP TBC domain-containing protein n=1 Tax=Eeniella nana TaxID=13502 RepID=A0A875RWA6_EENNA|nr:uncharacterized protein FOA43_000009 [Brettanomyces nanus]QPG72708.1 hypothetical protein FOA43_000009 [Brettanomyces nanus]
MRLQKKLKDIEKEATASPSPLLNTLDSLSDDELPDDLIVFDVPFSNPLKALSDHRTAYKTSMFTQWGSNPSGKLKRSRSADPVYHSGPYTAAFLDSTTSSGASTRSHESSVSAPGSFSSPSTGNFVHNGSLAPFRFASRSTDSTTSSHSASSSRSSPVTRASSIFSIASDLSEMSFMDDESSNLSFEGKLLNSNKDLRLDEALQRISMLKSMSHLSVSQLAEEGGPDHKSVLPSKEKLDCLSVTRQPNLPPKDRFESIKHQRDYESLVETQIHEEKQKLAEYRTQQDQLKKRDDHDFKLWQMVCQKYDILVCLPTTRELWWRGIPAKGGLRGSIWRHQLVGKRKLKCDLKQCLSEAHEIIDKACDYKTTISELGRKKFEKENVEIMTVIQSVEVYSNQIQRCFPNLLVFQLGTTFESVLSIAIAFDIMKAHEESVELSLIETGKLLHLICVLLKNLESEELTLHALIDLILKRLPRALLTSKNIPRTLNEQLQFEKGHQFEKDSGYLKDIKDQFDRFLLSTSPNVYNHFVQHGVNTLVLIQSATANLFSTLLNMDVLERILDIYIFEGDTFLLRCLLALIKKVSYKLYGSCDEIYKVLGENCLDALNRHTSRKGALAGYVYLDVGEADHFIRDVRSILRRHTS